MTRIFRHYNKISDRQPPTLQPSHPLEGIKKGITRKAKPVVGKATKSEVDIGVYKEKCGYIRISIAPTHGI